MKYATALGHYRTGLAIAEALRIKSQAVYQWKRSGVVPIKSAVRLEKLSGGKVRVDLKVYERANGRANARV
jgi:hypothetical protein